MAAVSSSSASASAKVSRRMIVDDETATFSLDVENGEARIDYAKRDGVLVMYETFVSEHLRNRGLARTLATDAFDYVVENGLKMKLTCTYLQRVYSENEEKYRDNKV